MLPMYLPEWVQNFKEPRTEIKKVGGHFYKYQVEYRYNKQKKRTDKVTVGLLGKITEQDGFVPSEKHLLKKRQDTMSIRRRLTSRCMGCTDFLANF